MMSKYRKPALLGLLGVLISSSIVISILVYAPKQTSSNTGSSDSSTAVSGSVVSTFGAVFPNFSDTSNTSQVLTSAFSDSIVVSALASSSGWELYSSVMAKQSLTSDTITTTTSSGSITETRLIATTKIFERDFFWLRSTNALPLVGGVSGTYRLEFDLSQDCSNEYRNGSGSSVFFPLAASNNYNGITQLRAVLFSNLASTSLITTDAHLVSANVNSLSNVLNGTTLGLTCGVYTRITLDLPITKSNATLYLAVRFQTFNWASSRKTNSYYLKNVAFTALPRNLLNESRVFLTEQTLSERVSLRFMDSALDSNPRSLTDCPWMDTKNLYSWQNSSIWPSKTLPNTIDGVNVTLPENTRVLVSSSTWSSLGYIPKFGVIFIPASSELVFADTDGTSTGTIALEIKGMQVLGKFLIGSPTCRFLYTNVEITITPPTSAAAFAAAGGATAPYMHGIAAEGFGQIDMHGQQFNPTWTRLATTVWPGDRYIFLQRAVNWLPGSEVAIVTSTYQDTSTNDKNEVRTISRLWNSGKVLELSSPALFHHYGGQEYQVEVGLLSRRIVIQSPTSSDSTLLGGHVMVMGSSTIGRFSGVQARRLGMRNIMGRYPFHFHMVGVSNNGVSHFIRDCAVYESYFRAITVHATSNSLVTRNVMYSISGNALYLEDGVEEENILSYNLAAKIAIIGTSAGSGTSGTSGVTRYSSSSVLVPTDTAAAGFYITNARNYIIGNAASGGFTGYDFPGLPAPTGLSRSMALVPSSRELLEFDGNTAHSTGWEWADAGACIYVGGELTEAVLAGDATAIAAGAIATSSDGYYMKYASGIASRDTLDKNGTKIWMKFTNTRVSLCRRGITHWGQKVDVDTFEAHDVERMALFFILASMNNALVNMRSGNRDLALFTLTAQGFQFYGTDVGTLVTNTEFRNYLYQGGIPTADYCGLIGTTIYDEYKPQGNSATYNVTFSGSTNFNSRVCHRALDTGGSRHFNFVDTDGSVTGTGVATIVGSHIEWWNYRSDCTWRSWGNGTWTCPKGSKEVISLTMDVPGYTPSETLWTDYSWIGNVTLWDYENYTNAVRLRDSQKWIPLTRNTMTTGINDFGWHFSYTNGSLTSFSIEANQIPLGKIVFSMEYPANSTFSVFTTNTWTGKNTTLSMAANFSTMLAADGNSYFFDGKYFFLNVKDKVKKDQYYYERNGAKIYTWYKAFKYTVTATCGSGLTVNGFCKSISTPSIAPFVFST